MRSQPAQPAQPALRLLGDPAVLLPDGSVRALERRAAGLLALVALEPGVTRARVASMLWPQSDDSRKALRQQLSRFRTLFGVPLVEGDDTLQLGAAVTTDLANGDAPLLGTLEFEDCEAFADWLSAQRAARQSRQTAPMLRALEQAEAERDYERALVLAGQLAALEPDSEVHARAQMRLHYLRGDLASAQTLYVRLRQRLRRRFGAAPSAETEAIARAIAAAGAAPSARRRASAVNAFTAPTAAASMSPAASGQPPVTVLRPPRLIGRRQELAALVAAWRDGRVALVLGEAGLGKSRLLSELATGQRLISVQGRPGDPGVPYAVLARLLREVLQRCATQVAQERRNELARLLPELAPGIALPSDGQRLLLQQAIEALLQNAQLDGAPLHGLVVDDLHFADTASVEMLQVLMVTPVLAHLRWVLAQRPGEGEPAVERMRHALIEADRLVTLPLAPLTEPDLAELLDSLLLDGLHEFDAPALAGALMRHTGGNPLYALETLKHGLASGGLRDGRLPQPQSVGALIERRLAQLSERALAVARVAAIAGVDFDIQLAEAVMTLQAVDLASAWAELERAQVLRDDAFAHDLVGDAVLRTIPRAVARRLHAQCAEWLQDHGGEPARVAEHWLAGGIPARAGAAFEEAARRAELAMRMTEGGALLLRAAAAFDAAGLPAERYRVLLTRMTGLKILDIGDAALQEARDLIAAATTARERLQAQAHFVGMLTERGEAGAAVQEGRPVIAQAREAGEWEVALRTACHLATALVRLGQVDEALAVLLPLRSWAETQPDPSLKMLWFGDWAVALGAKGRIREGVSAYEVAIAAARDAALPDAETRLVMNCAVTLRLSGQLDRAVELARQGRRRQETEAQDAAHVLIGRLVVARDESETGQYESALAALEDILPRFEATSAHFWAQATRMVMVRLWLDLGQPARAVPLLRDEPAELPAWLRVDRQLLQAETGLAQRQAPDASTVAATLALARTDAVRGPALQVRALRSQSPASVLEQAAPLLDVLTATERLGAVLGLHTHVARAAMACGQVQRAAQAASAAVELLDTGHAPDGMYRAEVHLTAARALHAAGQLADAERILEAGRRWVRQRALPYVPAAFIDSFLRRNAVNAALLGPATAWQRGIHPG